MKNYFYFDICVNNNGFHEWFFSCEKIKLWIHYYDVSYAFIVCSLNGVLIIFNEQNWHGLAFDVNVDCSAACIEFHCYDITCYELPTKSSCYLIIKSSMFHFYESDTCGYIKKIFGRHITFRVRKTTHFYLYLYNKQLYSWNIYHLPLAFKKWWKRSIYFRLCKRGRTEPKCSLSLRPKISLLIKPSWFNLLTSG